VQGDSRGWQWVWGGQSTSNTGTVGQSDSGNGVLGISNTGHAIVGLARNPGAGALAARFIGPVRVEDDLTVTGAKSAAVPHPDGSYPRLYSVESPESYFEDFGRARLADGRATVTLDVDFAALVYADDYDVYVTPRGACWGLYVASQDPNGFEVRELNNGASSITFSYRVLARRRDLSRARLEKMSAYAVEGEETELIGAQPSLTIPRTPDVPEYPPLPDMPRSPHLPRRK